MNSSSPFIQVFSGFFSLIILSSLIATPTHWKRDDLFLNPDGFSSYDAQAVAFADLNHDGEIDIIILRNNKFEYYQANGHHIVPHYQYHPYLESIAGKNTRSFVSVDLDSDGLEELVVNYEENRKWRLALWKNIGTFQQPDWSFNLTTFQTIDIKIPELAQNPTFTDFDHDNDLDFLIVQGGYYQNPPTRFRFFENCGTANFPQWQEDTTFVANLNHYIKNSTYLFSPQFFDINEDSLPDLVVNSSYDVGISYPKLFILNLTSSGFQWIEDNKNSFGINKKLPGFAQINFADVKGDGMADLISTSVYRGIQVYENIKNNGKFFINDMFYKLGGMKITAWATPVLHDHNQDGWLDLIAGGQVSYAGDSAPGIESYTAFTNSNAIQWLQTDWCDLYNKQLFDIYYPHISIIDFKNDGILDVILTGRCNDIVNQIYIKTYENFGNNQNFRLKASEMFPNLPAFRDTGYYDLSFHDLNGDSTLEILSYMIPDICEKFEGNYQLFSFTQNDQYLNLKPRPEWNQGIHEPNACYGHLFDYDEDGLKDIIFGRTDGSLTCYFNRGSRQEPLWIRNDSVFAGININSPAAPAVGDLDQDGDFDLIIGNETGQFFCFRNETSMGIEKTVTAKSLIPDKFDLFPNYPNPFNSGTNITFLIHQTTKPVHVKLKIYDLAGRLITSLLNTELTAGKYQVYWSGVDNSEKPVVSGIYFCVLKIQGYQKIERMMMIR